MKATVWLWPIVTLICFSPFVCTSAQQDFQEFPSDSNMIQDDYLLEKRTKPSLSIVNPLDVLRQRLLLEIARRQMKENTRQVEINRAILKNVGKRGNHHIQQQNLIDEHLPQFKLQQQQPSQLLQQQFQQKHYQMNPNSFFDYLRHEDDKKITSNGRVTGPVITDNDNLNGINDIDNGVDGVGGGGGGAGAGADDDYQIRYLYRLHKNRYSKK